VSNPPEARSAQRHGAGQAGTPPPVCLRVPALDRVAPLDAAEAFRDLPGLALLESARPGRTGRWSYLTADPIAIVDAAADGPDPFAEARSILARMGGDRIGERRVGGGEPGRDPAQPEMPPFGGGLVGFLGYDLGRRFERLPSIARVDQHLPALRLGLHDWTLAWDRRTGLAWLAARAVDGDVGRRDRRLAEVRARVEALGRGEVGPANDSVAGAAPAAFRSLTPHDTWLRDVEAVRDAIERGDIYQANLTRRLEAPFGGDPWPVFRRLRTGDPALFAGFLDIGASPATGRPRALLSASPEPFLSIDGEGVVSTDPIKGTRPRGRTREQDRALARELLASPKDQAENVMIVDVLRNDLGRVCEPGSVRVPRMLRLERTAAVQHLVTTVTGRLRPDADAFDLLAAAFPGGSITGAPKIRAMELIERLEPVRRGPYCGTLLWVGPDGRMGSSILIRTFVADGERLTLHVGGGITWRSDPVDEWDETVAKARGPLSSIGAIEAPS
jgi:para-aminobenzoate synthetase component I